MPLPDMPDDWTPETTQHVRFGRPVHVWRWKGHELACREGPGSPAFEAFRRETWSVRARLEAGATVIPYAHARRHDATARPVSHPTVRLEEPQGDA